MKESHKKVGYCPYCGVRFVYSTDRNPPVNHDGQFVCANCKAAINRKMEIHVEGSNHDEVMKVSSKLISQTQNEKSKSEIEVRLEELEYEYSLAKTGLLKGGFATVLAFLAGIMSLGAALYAFLKKGPGFISGNHLIVMFALMIGALIVYFSFVFGRAAKLKMDIRKQKKLLEISSGDNVRKQI